MRKLMYISIGFTLSCVLGIYVSEVWLRLLLAAAGCVLVSILGKEAPWLPKLLVLVLGVALGMARFEKYQKDYLACADGLENQALTTTIRALDYGEEGRYGTVFDGWMERGEIAFRVRVWLQEEIEVWPGMEFTGVFRFRTSGNGSYEQSNGIYVKAFQDETLIQTMGEPKWHDDIARLRRKIKDILDASFPDDTAPFAKSLLLGDTSDLSYETDTDLKISGIRHVVAVSGLHISILLALIGAVTFRQRILMAVLGFPVLFSFCALAGFSPSVTRACIMAGLMLLAGLLDREYDGPTALSFAVLVMLLCNPMLAASVSLQLSVASVAGIFLFAPQLRLWILSLLGECKGKTLKSRMKHWFSSAVSVSVSAQVLTIPLCAYYFGMISLVSVLTNLLTLWIISGIFYGIMAVCLLYLVVPGATIFAETIAIAIRYVLWISRTLADFPLAAVYTASPYIVVWIIFLYVLLGTFLVSGNRSPLLLLCCALLGLNMALCAGWWEPQQDSVRFTMLDVGQGQCLLFQSEGKTFLVDCGGDSPSAAADTAAAALLSQGITRLDGLIVTHCDADHAKGAGLLLKRLETQLLILPPVVTELSDGPANQILYAAEEMDISFGSTVIRVYPADYPGTSNEKSICILFDTEKCDILITGDRSGLGERILLRYTDIPEVDVLVAGHHGSADSTCEELLEAVKPELVFISAGRDNPFGHPDLALLQRLSQFGCTVYRTDTQGTITIRR